VSRKPALARRASQVGWWNALLGEVRGPLSSALETLAKHDRAIQRTWRRQLQRLGYTPDELDALSALALATYLPQIRTGNFESYSLALENAGEALARSGMPDARAVAALGAQLESALP
jgi:hypothetical protein